MENPFHFLDYNTYILIFGHIPNTQTIYGVHGKNAPVHPEPGKN